ncbi:ash family protein [Salmonella enterica]|nr:hypothetical protein [Salmonella enterica subsp. enterica]
MTKFCVRDYSRRTSAKSGVGIGVPDKLPRQRHAASVFFIVARIVTSQWWAVWGSREARRMVDRLRQPCTVHHP